MELNRAWRRALAAIKTTVALATAVACITTIATPVLAGTTGVINGYVTDSNHAPVAGVTVTLRSPSGSYSAVTNGRGFYAVAGVYADTYTASFEKSGYDGQVVTGISVFADQTATVNGTLNKSLRTIAHTTARSTASAYQPSQTNDTYTVNATQIQQFQGTDLNISESNLITSLPGAEYDSSGYPVIHGGRENEEGFEFEGIPFTDAFTNQFVNTLALPGSGVASAQLTPGSGDASVQSNGTGTLNLVAQRGTYPGFTLIQAGVGGGQYQHILNASISYAGANGHISDYAAFSGTNTSYLYGGGNYTANQTNQVNSTLVETDREFMNNLVFRFGHNNNQQLQFFADVAEHDFISGYGGYQGQCFESCNPFLQNFVGGYWGFTPGQVSTLTGTYPFQPSVTSTLASVNRSPGVNYQPNETYKVQYDVNLNPSTYLTAMLYSVSSVTLFDYPAGGANTFGDGDVYLYQGGHSLGGTLKLQKQFGDKNQFEAGYEYAWRHPEDSYVSQSYGWLADAFYGTGFEPYDYLNPSTNAAGTCPSESFSTPYPCGYAYSAYTNPPSQLTFPSFDQVASVQRADQSLYAQDKIAFTDNFNVQLGVRDEMSNYEGFPTAGLNSDCTFDYNPSSVVQKPVGTLPGDYNPADPTVTGNCPYIPTFDITRQQTNPNIFEPRLGLSWEFAKNSALRFTYDRSATFPFLSFVSNTVDKNAYYGYNGLPGYSSNCGIYPYWVSCNTYGEQMYWVNQNFNGVPYIPLLPMTSNNYQLTLEHQFTSGVLNGVAVSVAPWTRHQYDTEASLAQPLVINGVTQVVAGVVQLGPATPTNLGKEYASGVDLNITKVNPYGISGQWTASYINEFSSVIPNSSSEDFFPSIPYASGLLGGVYRVGFVSPFQTTLALSYKTRSGWRINPRFLYNIGYPYGTGTLTSTLIDGKPYTIPNTNGQPSSAAYNASGPNYYLDPMDPGTAFNPNIVASRGAPTTTSSGGKLTPPSFLTNVTVEYGPPSAAYKVGFDVENVFNKYWGGPGLNSSCQIVATGTCGPLSGYASLPLAYQYSYAYSQIPSAFGGQNIFTNYPDAIGRTYYVYYQVRI